MRLLQRLFHVVGNVSTHPLATLVFRGHHKRDWSLAVIVLLCAPIIAAAQPLIQSINPAQGPIAGGTQVTLTGSGFTGAALTLDGTSITPTSASDTQIVFQSPVHENGIASVQLSGNGPNAYAEFLYLPPSLKSLPPGYITTVMGIGVFRGDGRPATQAMLEPNEPGFALANDGSLFFSEHNQNVIRRVRTDGVMERYAGTGMFGYSGDGGPAHKAQLQSPRGLALDPSGNLLIADANNHCIRRIDASTGIITTLYGSSVAGFSGDGGPAANAQFNQPLQIAFDGAGNLYVLEFANRIRKIDTRGIITTIAGNGTAGFSGDGGPATQATLNVGTNDWGGLAADSQGNVYLADTANARVRRIDGTTGIITTFLADAVVDAGQAVRAIFADRNDNLYVGIDLIDSTSLRILKLSPTGQLLQSWGKGYGFSEDGTAIANAPLCQIHRLVLDPSGNILFADACSSRIRRINVTTGLLDTIAGMGPHIIGETGSALSTILANDGPDLLFLPSGDLLAADPMNYRIRKLDSLGNMSTIAGNGLMGIGGNDGVPALEAFMYPVGITLTPTNDLLMVNIAGISRIDGAGIIHAVNMLHNYGFSGDGGPASAAITNEPWDAATDAAGNIFIADSNNNRIRRIDAKTGIIDTVAGSGPGNGFENYGKGSYCGDGGPATQACLNTPYGVAIAPDGTMYIGENDERIRKVTPDGIISTFFSGRGAHVRLSSTGNLFTGTSRIQPNGHAFTFVFSNPEMFSNNPNKPGIGDGVLARSVQAGYYGTGQNKGIAIDGEGNLFFGDPGKRRVRAIRYGAVMAEPGSTVSISSGSTQTALTGTSFSTALEISLKSPEGTPENGIRVDFSAPSSGTSCTFPDGKTSYSTLTDIAGHASVTCTANTQAGSYRVTAAPLALGQSASFSLTNSKTLMIAGVGNVTSSLLGFDCSSSCSPSVNEGSSVTLDAHPGTGESFLGWSGACSGTASTCTFTASTSAWVGATFTGITLDLVKGWNLVGNSFTAPITVTDSFKDATRVTTVWKWVTTGTTAGVAYPAWAFYAPAQSDGGQAFAAKNGYEFLTIISGGEGFWVNAKSAFTVQLPGVTAVASTSFKNMSSGWHLIATGEQPTPGEFNAALSVSPPTAGTVPQNLTSLWAWDSARSTWYFHAPSLEAQGGSALTDYIDGKAYLDFVTTGKFLEKGTGFWVNKP
ncbi:MAG: IPT/TIG domain-containing protein [Sterolibacterium sp.]